eukprot:Lithocolla_globosa_v1_NODE_6948_length_1010_cov_17.237448.p2 type:complete len:103 gc:universal NODE_6948_length_1010_cov_17.237448:601-909(+)
MISSNRSMLSDSSHAQRVLLSSEAPKRLLTGQFNFSNASSSSWLPFKFLASSRVAKPVINSIKSNMEMMPFGLPSSSTTRERKFWTAMISKASRQVVVVRTE